MTPADLVAGVLWLAATAYAVLAGADFGGGVWDLLASGPRAAEQRRAVAVAMGPVWEANHVWLIFLIVGLYTAFPTAFGALATAFYVPSTLVMIGIVLRGAAFAFRAHGRQEVGPQSRWGVVFGSASVIAPFFLATIAAAVAVGSPTQTGWMSPFAILIGAFALSICAYLAATYLVVETDGTPLEADFRRRALISGIVAGAISVLALALTQPLAPNLAHALFGHGLPLVVLAFINGPLALWAVWRGRSQLARIAVVAQIVFVLWAWGVGQWPYLVPPDLRISDSAAPGATLVAWLVVVGIGSVLLVPSLALLFVLFKARSPAPSRRSPDSAR